jgi:hypothetical protein
MKFTSTTNSTERWSLRLAGAFAAISLILASRVPQSAAAACRLAIFVCLSPSIGCVTFALIHRITGGRWTADLAPFIRAGVAILPWTWLVAAPVLLLSRTNYSPGFGYDGFVMVAMRSVLLAVFFFGLKWALSDGVGDEQDARRNVRTWVGPLGLILLFFLLTFLADDWLESMDANWHSTAFTVVWIAGQGVCGLSLCILSVLLTGSRPAAKGIAASSSGLDWGNLLLAALMFWAYVSFAQFLIIWAGNLPEETSWYLRRAHGAWVYVVPVVALTGFAIPFFMLLSRHLKKSAKGLTWVAGMLLAAQFAYLAWLVVPAQENMPQGGGLLSAAVLLAALALFSNRFVREARRIRGGA